MTNEKATRYAFVIEIGCEELPPNLLQRFSQDFADGFKHTLKKYELTFGAIHTFATPRRLAVQVTDLISEQQGQEVTKKGPSLKVAFDAERRPTKAAEGFACSCNVAVDKLTQIENKTGTFLAYRYRIEGKQTVTLLPEICSQAIAHIKIPKPMHWGNSKTEFIRPVHWLLMLYGGEAVPAKILGLTASNKTYGHRFHHPSALSLKAAGEYERTLAEKGFVIADFNKRKEKIRQGIMAERKQLHAQTELDTDLLNEVTGLVEWPVVLTATFNDNFLKIPPEALISAMKTHQKAFPVVDKAKQLLPYFIFVANIDSQNPKAVVIGNERVMRARLSDAAFFYQTDCSHRFESRLGELKRIVFQANLGTLYEKAQRISKLAGHIGAIIADKRQSERAGLLAKCDLVSDMVKEFPELQGTMGCYYARYDGEHEAVADAIRDHYLPRFSGDKLPTSAVGDAVALADRLDTLIAIFGIHQLPTGDKDPLGLRRAAVGVIRILIEHAHALNIRELLEKAKMHMRQPLPNQDVVAQVRDFILERLRHWYQEKQIAGDTFNAVIAAKTNADILVDFDRRMLAVEQFRQLPEARALAAANKRASNILTKNRAIQSFDKQPFELINTELFKSEAENHLFTRVRALYQQQQQKIKNRNFYNNYTDLLADLATLRAPVDQFFDNVMVMTEDEKLRDNRLALLAALRELFLTVADISKLQVH